ncbi:MAG: MFS transporter [Bosea sp.]|jgi:MFS family permease|nr:MFS transporter [Bosea sp. (in: a-proteobacteria)]
MLPAAFHRLTAVAAGFRGADQLMVAGTPLVVAALFGGGPDIVGLIVAVQGSAWLLMSLPAGVWVDRIAPLNGLKAAMAMAVAGVLLAMAGLGAGHLALFAAGAFLSASAAVVGFLAESASVQALVQANQLPRANARLQLVQSSAALAGPALMGLAVLQGWTMQAYLLAGFIAALGLAVALGFGRQPARAPRMREPLAEIAEGFAFVRRQPLLVGIVACALFWNMAFFALTAVFVPFALGPLGLNAAETGIAQSAMGIGSLAAALLATMAMARLSPRLILVFGPASSMLASVILALSPQIAGTGFRLAGPVAVFLLLGFGPILWFVCQNSIRQLVTPSVLLGRVGSVIQVAIYGVRSVGALLGGIVAARFGFSAAMGLIVGLFAASLLAVLASSLARLRTLPPPAALQA